MRVAKTIEDKVREALQPAHLLVENESQLHSGPATESHFRLEVVAEEFAALSRVQRHQRLYKLLADELRHGVHALALHLYTPGEWAEENEHAPASPDCRGGG